MSGHDFTRSLVKKLIPAMMKDGLVPAVTGPASLVREAHALV